VVRAAGSGVGVQDALLNGLVESPCDFAVLQLNCFNVSFGDGLAKGSQAGAHPAAVGAIHFGTGFGLTGGFE
jgi:hypothetical protein